MSSSPTELQVKEHFDHTGRYLAGNDGIKIRQDITRQFLGDQYFSNILDVACGDGSISIPLLREGAKLTLLDISRNMLEIAAGNVPQPYRNQVKLMESGFATAELEKNSFDLVICLGLLAHIPEPLKVTARLAGLVKPQGHLLIQNTDSRHPWSWISMRLGSSIKRIAGLRHYPLNTIAGSEITELLKAEGFVMKNRFSYIVSYPLVSRHLKGGRLRRMVSTVFGDGINKRNQWLGNDVIMHFVKER